MYDAERFVIQDISRDREAADAAGHKFWARNPVFSVQLHVSDPKVL